MRYVEKYKKVALVVAACLALANAVVWGSVWRVHHAAPRLVFLDVGQGDSELVEFSAGGGRVGNIQLLIDGGPPGGRAVRELGRVLSPTDRYVDLVLMTHAQEDHFGGLVETLRRYDVGAFLWSGRPGETDAYRELAHTLDERGVRQVVLGAGDRIRVGGSVARVLAPTPALLAERDLNDTSVVLHLTLGNMTALFTGDAGPAVERSLTNAAVGPVDVLKVGHHGSRFSSSERFLEMLQPALAVIEVGKNSYGHPTRDTLSRLTAVGSAIFRTDERGTVEVRWGKSGLRVSSSR